MSRYDKPDYFATSAMVSGLAGFALFVIGLLIDIYFSTFEDEFTIFMILGCLSGLIVFAFGLFVGTILTLFQK